MPRRGVLRWAVGATGVAAAAAAYALHDRGPAVAGLRVLSPRQFRTVEAIVDTIVPAGGAFPVGGRDVGLAREIDAYLAVMPDELQGDLKLGLTYIEYAPVLVRRKLGTFSGLPASERARVWGIWETSGEDVPSRLTMGVRRLCFSKFYDHEEVWPYIGYPGPLFTEHM
jgi:hypothetical protein